MVSPPRQDFWQTIRKLANSGWTVAQHGFSHRYLNSEAGLLDITHQSEFTGLTYAEQYQKISQGKQILENKLARNIDWWMAPSHSFDQTTCRVLKDLKFNYITDGLAIFPFSRFGLTWLPQQLWQPVNLPFGIWTICIHPNKVNSNYLERLDLFIKEHTTNIVSPENAIKYNSGLIETVLNYIFKIIWKGIYFLKN
jgi:hypothetical protein